jgi:hypothetical protein
MLTQPKRTKKSASQAPLARSPGCQLRGDPTIDRTGSPGGSQPFTQHSSGFTESSCRSSQRGCRLRARLARHRDRARGPNVHTADFRTLSRASRGPSQRLPGRADLDRVRIGLGLRGSQPGEWISPLPSLRLPRRRPRLPIDQIRQTVRPTADQEAALDNLSLASSQASEIIKSSCPASVPLTAIGRLDVAEQRLDATIKAIRMVPLPLERFYETLSDEQRGRFNAMKGSTEGLVRQAIWQPCAVGRRAASSPCRRNASNRWFNRLRNSRAPSTISSRQRRKWATNRNRPVRPRCRNRPWRGSLRSKRG